MDASHSTEINDLVKRFTAHQKALGLTPARYAARYKQYVGSHKTWLKLMDGSWPGHVTADKQLAKLKLFADQLDGARSFDAEQFFSTMPYVTQMLANVEDLLASPLDIRILVSLAPQGIGKSWLASHLVKTEKSAPIFYLRLLHSWRERSYKIQCAIALKVGCPISKNPGDQLDDLIKHCKALGDFILIMDEAHNGGIVLFKLIKDLIDETQVRVIYLGYPTEYDIIIGSNRSAIGESRQTLRRTLQPIHDDYRDGIMEEDVEMYLASSGLKRNKELTAVAAEILPLIKSKYNLTTLATAVRDARAQAEEEGGELTAGLVTEAVKALCSTAASRREAMKAAAAGGAK